MTAIPLFQQIQFGKKMATMALELVSAFWIQEFKVLLPEGIKRGFGRTKNHIITITLDGDHLKAQSASSGITAAAVFDGPQAPPEAMAELLAKLKTPTADKDKINLFLPEQLFFTRNIQLPTAAIGNLDAIVKRDMEARTPFRAGEVLFTYQLAHHAPDIITVTQTIIKVTILQRQLAKAGLSIDRLLAVSTITNEDKGVTIPILPDNPLLSLALKRSIIALWISGTVLILGNLWGGYSSRSSIIIELEQRTQSLRTKATGVRTALDQLATENAMTEELRRRKWQMPNQRDIVEELTRILPQTAWLTDLTISEKDVAISGYANGAADLVAAFRSSILFSGASLTAPIVTDPVENRERFSISIQFRAENAKSRNGPKSEGSAP